MSESATGAARADELSALVPYPAPIAVPADYDRHDPSAASLRAVLDRIATQHDWAGASWPELIEGLLRLGRTDVPLSRLAEGHVDALRILAQADAAPRPDALYGVWASRSQRTGVRGRWRTGSQGRRLVLDGGIRFASGAGLLDRALVPVWIGDDEHLLVDLAVDELPIDVHQWATAAMEVSRSHTVDVAGLAVGEADQIGPLNFYLARPAFFPGGIGVAACWAGGAARVADLTLARLTDPAPALAQRLGRIVVQLAIAGAVVRAAADRVESALSADSPDPRLLQVISTECRAAVAGAVHTILAEAQRAAGPAGLAYDRSLTRAVHDLQLYVLQQNADADERFLGGPRG